MKTLALLLLLCSQLCAHAQVDSTQRAHYDSLWLRQRNDGRISHDLPPPANVVAAGYALVHQATVDRDARWLRIGSIALGTVLYLADDEQRLAAPLTVAGIGFSYSIALNFRGTKSERYAGHHLQSGYSVNTRYDIIPDEVGEGPHTRLLLQPTARMPRKTRRGLRAIKKAMEVLKDGP
jgi:hypothetical protein